MERKKIRHLILVIVLGIGLSPVYAQTRGNNEAQNSSDVRVLFFPEFYHHEVVRNGDTTLKYECYDDKDGRINLDTLHSSDPVDEIIFVKSFFDRRFSSGPGISQPYITNKVMAYNKVATNTWAATDVTTSKSTELKGDINKIVRTDTTIGIDPTTGVKRLTVLKYYKLAEVPDGEKHIIKHAH